MPDSLAERGEFELPVPICEQSDDSIRLSFATSRRTAKRYRPGSAFLVRFSQLVGSVQVADRRAPLFGEARA